MEDAWEKTVFVCGEGPEDILTAVYDAWASRKGHSRVRLEVEGGETRELFASYVPVETDPEKARKVRQAIEKKIGFRAWQMVYRASLSQEESRADDVYRFLVGGFYYGSRVLGMLAEPAVSRIRDLSRAVGNEAHHFREFLRFEERAPGVLFGRFQPKCQALPLLMPYFSDRLPGENFLILDTGRRQAGVHPAGEPWYLALLPPEAEERLSRREDAYPELWKTFCQAIAVEQRKNPRLQRSMLPLRYRTYMTEFSE